MVTYRPCPAEPSCLSSHAHVFVLFGAAVDVLRRSSIHSLVHLAVLSAMLLVLSIPMQRCRVCFGANRECGRHTVVVQVAVPDRCRA